MWINAENCNRVIDIFKMITPRLIWLKLSNIFWLRMISKRRIEESKLPQLNLEKKHVQNTRVLLNREELLKQLPKYGMVAEIGVDEGAFSDKILRICHPERLHLIDIWATKRYSEDKFNHVKKRFYSKLNLGIVRIHRKLSTVAAEDFADEYFDWIYIDTDHSYEVTINELIKYENKVKKNGIIAGHDYILGSWINGRRFGVIEAVHEFCVTRNWEILYVTSLNEEPSFAIRRISAG
jgi:hypothetical protein